MTALKVVEEDRYASDAIAYASDLDTSTVSDIVDPLLLTEYNEHVLERYGRAAYVILCLGRPEKGIKGWETDRGQTFLKFGKPLGKRIVRPGIDEFTYLQIDVSQVPSGIHKLTITAHDKVGKTVAHNETFFRIIRD